MRVLAAVFSVFFIITATFQAKAELLGIKGYTLDNGMRLIVIPNHKAPIAKQMVWYKVGAKDETIGKGGAAHLLEHLMFRGTKKVKGKDFNRIMEENGAVSNAFTSQDVTVYHQFTDISRLELAMFLEADRMANLKIDDEGFETERQIVYQERKQVVENNPFYQFNEEVARSFWQNHPYSRPITGTETEILNLKIEDVRAIYDKYYAPDNAVLIIAGDINPDTAYHLAQKYYGKIPAKGFTNNKSFPQADADINTSFKMSLKNIEIPRLLRKYEAPSYSSDKEQIYAWMVLSKYIGEEDTSALYQKMVVNDKVATSVSSSYNYTSLGGGSFSIVAVPSAGISVEKLQEALDEALKVSVDEFNDNTLKKIKKKMRAGLIYIRDNPTSAAQIAGTLALAGMSDEEIENYADNINKVTLSEVKKAAAAILKPAKVEAVAIAKGEKK